MPGVSSKGYDGIVTMDGNGKDGVEAIETFVSRLQQGYDYVQGSRYRSGGRAINTPIDRTIAGRLIHAPLLSLAGRRCDTDTTNGFRAYSAGYLRDPLRQSLSQCIPALRAVVLPDGQGWPVEVADLRGSRHPRISAKEQPLRRRFPDYGDDRDTA